MPHRSQPLHFSGATTCGGWYPLELKADDSASTLVGQNSTQKPQDLQRSTMMETRPFATCTPHAPERFAAPELFHYRRSSSHQGVIDITNRCELGHGIKRLREMPDRTRAIKKGGPHGPPIW